MTSTVLTPIDVGIFAIQALKLGQSTGR